METTGKVFVCVRIRPKLDSAVAGVLGQERYAAECAKKVDNCVRLSEQKGKEIKTHGFSFDHVFDKDNTQEEVYEDVALDCVDSVVRGCNATIITYGQTGSGKTYTVLGQLKHNPLSLNSSEVLTGDTGLFLRVLKDLIEYKERVAKTTHVRMSLSVIEIYNESVRDLLSKDGQEIKPNIHDSIVLLPDLTITEITSIRDALNAYKIATGRRVTRGTQSNDTSSRSHALFMIDVFQQMKTPDSPDPPSFDVLIANRDKFPDRNLSSAASFRATPTPVTPPATPQNMPPGLEEFPNATLIHLPRGPPVVHSKIVLSDLAGSERLKKSEAKGIALEEMKSINTSLTSLGNVVHALHENQRHIPYRDSKLTVILRSAFASANSRVVLIANVSPTNVTCDETLSTLYFANKVKQMKVGSAIAADTRIEMEYFNTLKMNEELCAEIRVLKEQTDFPAHHLRMNTTVLLRPPYFIPENPLKAEFRARKEKELRRASQIWADQHKLNQENRRCERDQEVNAVYAETKQQHLAMHAKSVRVATETLSSLQAHNDEIRATLSGEAVSKEGEKEAMENETQSLRCEVEKLRVSLQAAQDRVAERQVELSALEKEKAAGEKRFMQAHSSQEKEWNEQSDVWEKKSQYHSSVASFADMFMDFSQIKVKYFAGLLQNIMKHDAAEQSKRDAETAEISSWLKSVLEKLAQNAVSLSSSSKRAATTAAPRKSRGGSIYDSPGLLQEVLLYLQGGTVLLKYGRSGKPHYRKFVVGFEPRTSLPQLCWSDVESLSSSKRPTTLDLTAVTNVVLGQYTKTFRKSKLRDDRDFYLSFSILYIKKGQPRELNLLCETEAELEAWVIGLSRLTKIKPSFGEPRDISTLPMADSLAPKEAQLCRSWHIFPKAVKLMRQRVIEVCTRRKVTVPGYTAGELRYITQLDIFRATALWELLLAEGVISDPDDGQAINYLTPFSGLD